MATTSRLLALLSLLQTRRDWPGRTLSDRLEISPRTVRRDIERLREMGYRIGASKGPDGGYRLDAGAELPPLLFDDDQAVTIGVALQAAALSGAGLEEAALRALTTVRQVMPSRLRHRVDAVTFTSMTAGAPAVSPRVLIEVSAAIRAREVLRFDYAFVGEQDADLPARRVEPHHLISAAHLWYLVAWDLDRDDWRIFRADRVTPRVPTGPRFTPRDVPGGDVRAFVSGRFQGSDHRSGWPCVGTVTLQLPARDVIPFAGDGIVTPLDDDTCTLEAGAWSWIALAASFGRFDAAMSDARPPELAAAFAELAERYRSASAG